MFFRIKKVNIVNKIPLNVKTILNMCNFLIIKKTLDDNSSKYSPEK